MTTALVYLGGSLASAAVFVLLYLVEDAKGHRIFLSSFRSWLDKMLARLFAATAHFLTFYGKAFIRLLFHYGAQALLKKMLNFLHSIEKKVENLVRKNKMVAREINIHRVKTHLDELSEHKQDSALTQKQRDKMQLH